jgi:hypothetical protein
MRYSAVAQLNPLGGSDNIARPSMSHLSDRAKLKSERSHYPMFNAKGKNGVYGYGVESALRRSIIFEEETIKYQAMPLDPR